MASWLAMQSWSPPVEGTFLPKSSSFLEALDVGVGACCPCLSLSFPAATTSNPNCGCVKRYLCPMERAKYFHSISLAVGGIEADFCHSVLVEV